MRLTLLKSAAEPNVDADREIHEFTYSLYPHSGDFRKGNVVKMAYALNCPMYTRIEEAHEGSLPQQLSFISVDKDNVVVEVVKKAEDSDHIIVRLYECFNQRAKVKCNLLKNIQCVEECDLLENTLNELKAEGNSFNFEIKPYEIRTFKIKL
jgi:alpha-mannosidase